MWIEIQASVIAVAEVEMTVEHQHLELLQVLQRLLADFVFPFRERGCHREILASALMKSGLPPTSVAATPPRSSHPSKGVFFDRDRIAAACTRTRRSGAMIVMSAGAPSASDP